MSVAKVRGHPTAGAAVDVVKCYDELIRQIIIVVAHVCGMPRPILHLYYAFLHSLLFMTRLVGGYGQPRNRRISIPHRCHLVMTF